MLQRLRRRAIATPNGLMIVLDLATVLVVATVVAEEVEDAVDLNHVDPGIAKVGPVRVLLVLKANVEAVPLAKTVEVETVADVAVGIVEAADAIAVTSVEAGKASVEEATRLRLPAKQSAASRVFGSVRSRRPLPTGAFFIFSAIASVANTVPVFRLAWLISLYTAANRFPAR